MCRVGSTLAVVKLYRIRRRVSRGMTTRSSGSPASSSWSPWSSPFYLRGTSSTAARKRYVVPALPTARIDIFWGVDIEEKAIAMRILCAPRLAERRSRILRVCRTQGWREAPTSHLTVTSPTGRRPPATSTAGAALAGTNWQLLNVRGSAVVIPLHDGSSMPSSSCVARGRIAMYAMSRGQRPDFG